VTAHGRDLLRARQPRHRRARLRLVRHIPVLLLIAASGATIALGAANVPVPRVRPGPESSVALPRERPAELAAGSAASSVPPASSEVSAEPSSSAEPSIDSSSSASSSLAPPPPPPPRIYQTACPAVMNGQVTAKPLPPVHEGQCGAQSPLSIEAISANGRSIPLNAPVVTDCGMASALPGWLSDVEAYVEAHEKTRIKTLVVGTGYDCRNVDHAAVGNLSFHALADAIDVIGFTLEDGRSVSISPGFNGTPAQGHDILHFARDAACTHFMTVLSPDADAFHQDNLHLDLGCHGKSCTARLCE
jgi:hypothetical protein